MRDMARRPEKDRAELFRATAQAMRVHEAVAEKDFWVCWILDYLFHDSPWRDRIAFKGGTSLSKAYGTIERFSEDIDLILDWRLLGYSEHEPWEARSTTKQDAFGKEANQRTVEFLERDFAPALTRDLSDRVGAVIEVAARGQDVLIQYPRAFSLDAIHPQIRLEIGPLASWFPNEQRSIRPYAAANFPKLFTRPTTPVRTITVARTFWEKATILHQEAHRGPERPLPTASPRRWQTSTKRSSWKTSSSRVVGRHRPAEMLVLDANILVRAVLGRRVRRLVEMYAAQGIQFFAPAIAFEEAKGYLPALLEKRGTATADLSATRDHLQRFIESVDHDLYGAYEHEARTRLQGRDEGNWPLLAAALAMACPVWTEDTDFFGTGVPLWITNCTEIFLRGQIKPENSQNG